MRNLFLITLLLSLFMASCTSTRYAVTGDAVNPSSVFFAPDTTPITKYRITIQTKDTETTGIFALKYAGGEWRGSLINEVGAKAFDFIASDGRCHLINLISFLDKWYIRQTIESDFAFLFYAPKDLPVKGKSFQVLPGGAFVLKNEKRNIVYSFQPFEQ
ncbi:MAG: hypothetical protein LBC40_00960 [Dysgonamonadaceae bacterium]|jgi:hypothetical protein|nr:hypothetical protein [Dysgonamonadaceae bacterium]